MIREADEDGVTETIGFIFIFGIVILSMSLIYAMGYPQLQSNMAANVFESTEQSFIVLQRLKRPPGHYSYFKTAKRVFRLLFLQIFDL